MSVLSDSPAKSGDSKVNGDDKDVKKSTATVPGSAGARKPVSSLSQLPAPSRPAGAAPAAFAAAAASGSGSLTTSPTPSGTPPSPNPLATVVRSGSGNTGGAVVGGGVTVAATSADEIMTAILAQLLPALESKLDARLATFQEMALASLPKAQESRTGAKKAKTGLLGALFASAGHKGHEDSGKDAEPADDDAPPAGDDDDDDDDAFDAGGRTVGVKAPSGLDLSKPIARLLWSDEVAPYGTALSYVRMHNFREQRNRHECEVLALSLDEMVREKIPMTSLSFEIQIRRLLGVRFADEFHDWSFAEAVAWRSAHGVQNRKLLRALLKDRKIVADLKKPAATTSASQSFKGARGNGSDGGSGRGGRFGGGRRNGGGRGGGRGGGAGGGANNAKPSPAGSGAAAN